MGIKKKHTPGCSCCACAYVGSDGNEYSDDFASLDAGWTGVNTTLSVSGGQFIVDPLPGVLKYAYRTVSVTQTALLVVIEANVYNELTEPRNPGIFFGTPSAVTGYDFSLIPRFATGQDDWAIWSFGVSYVAVHGDGVGPAPADGDAASIKLTDAGGGNVRACYFVNGELIYEETGAWTFGATEIYGCNLTFRGVYDNFTIHVGNP